MLSCNVLAISVCKCLEETDVQKKKRIESMLPLPVCYYLQLQSTEDSAIVDVMNHSFCSHDYK